jgi:hypothetical protein
VALVSGRLGALLRDWDVFLAIMAAGLLTGLIVFMAFDGHPGACRHLVTAHTPGRVHLTWVCSRPLPRAGMRKQARSRREDRACCPSWRQGEVLPLNRLNAVLPALSEPLLLMICYA